MAEPLRWLALGYSVPINPSKNRVYVWRKLKEYGAEYFKQGVALLPYTRSSYSKFKYLSAKIVDMGGEASIVEMKFLDSSDEQDMILRFRSQELEELNELKKDCAEIMAQLSRQTAWALTELQSDEIKKLIRRYSKARERSHFCGTLAEDVEHGLYSLIDILRSRAGDAALQFARAMDKAVK
ncbi:MAG: hypothetical protein J6A26_04855 [Oscillospiraceae bacterium]|nr:hypothetical protein [Oscillospiraceae bacterium]